jgi:hypothetical protein
LGEVLYAGFRSDWHQNLVVLWEYQTLLHAHVLCPYHDAGYFPLFEASPTPKARLDHRLSRSLYRGHDKMN